MASIHENLYELNLVSYSCWILNARGFRVRGYSDFGSHLHLKASISKYCRFSLEFGLMLDQLLSIHR
jgi:hypothetical protein